MFYQPKYLGQTYEDPREQYRIPGRHTSHIDNGALVGSPYRFDQPEVEANLAARAAAPMQMAFEQPPAPDPLQNFASRYRQPGSYRDMLSGNTQAGTAGLRFIDDPQFQGLTREQQNALTQRLTGRTLDDQLSADSIIRAGGQPMTWADIESAKNRQALQKQNLGVLRAFEQYGGVRDVGDLLRNYDPNTQSYSYETGKQDDSGMPLTRTLNFAQPEIDALAQAYRGAGLPEIQMRKLTQHERAMLGGMDDSMRGYGNAASTPDARQALMREREYLMKKDAEMPEQQADAILNWDWRADQAAREQAFNARQQQMLDATSFRSATPNAPEQPDDRQTRLQWLLNRLREMRGQ